MAFLFSNNAQTTLAESLTSTATTLNVVSGKGSLFPTPSNGDLFAVTITSANNPDEVEICHCSAVNGDTLTIARGKDNTTAQSFSAGDLVSLFPTAGVTSLFAQNGYLGSYSASVAADIGGYPLNAIVADSSSVGVYWVSTVAANTTAPGAPGASWQSLFNGLAVLNESANFKSLSTTDTLDLSDDGNNVPTTYWVKAQGYALSSDIPSLSGYATQAWVQNQGYATQTWVQGQNYTTLSAVASVGYVTGTATTNVGVTNLQAVNYTGTDNAAAYVQVATNAGTIGLPTNANVAGQISSYAQPKGDYIVGNTADLRVQAFTIVATDYSTVNFPSAFSGTPLAVMVTPAQDIDVDTAAYNYTNTSFTIRVVNRGSTAFSVIAIGPK